MAAVTDDGRFSLVYFVSTFWARASESNFGFEENPRVSGQ